MSAPCISAACDKLGVCNCGDAHLNAAIASYVSKCARCRFLELYDIFGAEVDSPGARLAFTQRLARLVQAGALQSHGRDEVRYWQAPAVANAAAPTPSREYDVMHAPLYVPEAGPALREGALDFKRYASYGHAC